MFTLEDRKLGCNLVCIICAIIGVIMLANPFEIVVHEVNYVWPVTYLLISVIALIMGKSLNYGLKESLPLSSGSFVFYFLMMLIVPTFMIIAFSVQQVHINYGVVQVSYFLVNGGFTWIAIVTLVRTLKRDRTNKLEIFAYLAVIFTILLSLVFNSYETNETAAESEPPAANLLQETQENTSTTLIGQHTLGSMEYVAVSIMLLPRFGYYLYKINQK